jgi:putative phosphoesterase
LWPHQTAPPDNVAHVTVRLGVIGDTQGRYHVAALMEQVRRHFDGVDEVWHAGDWQYPEVLEELRQIAPLTVVNGNAPDDPSYPMQVVRQIEGWRVGMVHRPPRPADPWASSLQICIHGHTHHWRDEEVDGVRFINVSTPTAAAFSRDRTAGLLTLRPGTVDLRRLEFSKP